MAKINSLYRDYFQKSRVFLYPILEIKRGVSTTPVETYIKWDEHIDTDSCKLLCTYHLREDEEFTRFEKVKLFGNKLFYDYKELEEDIGLYIFDIESIKEDYYSFLEGKYSTMSAVHKRKIKNFYGQYSGNFAYIESFLHPEKYFEMYSELLGVPVSSLMKVGELCSSPDLEKETLVANIKSFEPISNIKNPKHD